MGRKVCLVGMAEPSRDWANEQPADVEVWGLNECHKFIKRWDLWFQIHPKDWKEAEREAFYSAKKGKTVSLVEESRNAFGRNGWHLDWLATCGVPVIMRDVDPRIPTSLRYPYEEALQQFGTVGIDGIKHHYMTSTMAYMLVYALMLPDIEEIRLAGIELAYGTEYFFQRACVEYYLGIAKGRGIKVEFAPVGCSLLNAPLYAIDDPIPLPKDFIPGYELRFRMNRLKDVPVVNVEPDKVPA